MIPRIQNERCNLIPRVVSIVIPCYNSLSFVEDAISSAYAQTYKHIEVIVVDDGSTDGSYELLLELKSSKFQDLIVSIHPERKNLGVSTTRQKGVSLASGEFIAFLDADDMFAPEKIAKQVEVLMCNKNAVLCHTAVSIIGDTSQAERFERNFGDHPKGLYCFRKRDDYLIRNGTCLSSVLIRMLPLRKIPFAMPQLFQYEDWLCWCLLAAHGKFVFIPEQLTFYRLHDRSATASVIQNKLKQDYSLLEMKLALVVKSESLSHSLKCLLSACSTLLQLLLYYTKPESGIGRGEYKVNFLLATYFRIRDFKRRLVSMFR